MKNTTKYKIHKKDITLFVMLKWFYNIASRLKMSVLTTLGFSVYVAKKKIVYIRI